MYARIFAPRTRADPVLLLRGRIAGLKRVPEQSVAYRSPELCHRVCVQLFISLLVELSSLRSGKLEFREVS